MLTLEQKRFLLELARQTVAAIAGDIPPSQPPLRISGCDYGGAFVTYRHNRRMRGCMGTLSPPENLVTAVQEAAISAARDPRFLAQPIQVSEVPNLEIEISVLGKPQEIGDPLSLELGKHGIIVEHPLAQGCFLPHVALEFGWNQQELLRRCCRDKARLPPDAWRDPAARVLIFTAEAFSNSTLSDRADCVGEPSHALRSVMPQNELEI